MKYRNDLDRHFHQKRYLYLLIATVLQIFLNSFFPKGIIPVVNGVTITLFMLACVNLVRHNRKIVFLFLSLAALGIILTWFPDRPGGNPLLFPAQKILVILFNSLIIYHIVIQIIKSKKVDPNVIFGAIAIYIIFGLFASEINLIIAHYDHSAFSGNLDPADPSELRYFTYVNMTTTGFGDITPHSRISRAASVFFSLAGQIYLAVIIAYIVGKYVAHSDKKERA